MQTDGDGEASEQQLAARRNRRLGLSAPVDAADRADQARDDAENCATTSSTAPTGCASPARTAEVVVVYSGAIAPEAIEAVGLMAEDRRDVGLLAVTSADRLNAGWSAAQRARERGLVHARSHIERLLGELPPHCGIVTRGRRPSGDPGLARRRCYGHRARALGVEHFGQTGSLAEPLPALRYRRECHHRRGAGDQRRGSRSGF